MVQNNLLEWFIVAFVSFADTDKVKIKLMQEGFESRPACIYYLQNTPSVINDIQKMEPNNTGMWFQCLDKDDVARYEIKRESI